MSNEEDFLDNKIQLFEDVTLKVMASVIKDLKHEKDWVRLKAQDTILNRTLPPRKTRAIKLDIYKIRTLDDVVLAKELLFFKLISGRITTEETTAYLSVLDSIKDTMADAKYVNMLLTFKEFARNNEGFQSFLKQDAIPQIQ